MAEPVRPIALEREIGLFSHATRSPGVGGRLKARIEDFRVEEVGGRPPEDATGPYTAARVRLSNWETNAFVREASQRLGVSRKKVHWSGTKDKRGVTERWFTFEAPPTEVASLGRLSGVEVVESFRSAHELALGVHTGNRFRIILRNVDLPVEEARRRVAAVWQELEQLAGAPNFFGPQRFGAVRATTHRVGERMIRGDFDGAVHGYLDETRALADESQRPDWKTAMGKGDWPRALELLDGGAQFERALVHRLVETKGDAMRALLALPVNLQRLFVYAYQSWIFNRILSRRMERGMPLREPLVGDLVSPIEGGEAQEEWIPVGESNLARAATEARRGRAVVTGLLPGTQAPTASGVMGRIEQEALDEEKLAPRDFLVPEHLEWSSKGTRRPLLVPVEDFEFECDLDSYYPGRTAVTFRFALPAGSYATSVLREFSKSPRTEDYA